MGGTINLGNGYLGINTITFKKLDKNLNFGNEYAIRILIIRKSRCKQHLIFLSKHCLTIILVRNLDVVMFIVCPFLNYFNSFSAKKTGLKGNQVLHYVEAIFKQSN